MATVKVGDDRYWVSKNLGYVKEKNCYMMRVWEYGWRSERTVIKRSGVSGYEFEEPKVSGLGVVLREEQ